VSMADLGFGTTWYREQNTGRAGRFHSAAPPGDDAGWWSGPTSLSRQVFANSMDHDLPWLPSYHVVVRQPFRDSLLRASFRRLLN